MSDRFRDSWGWLMNSLPWPLRKRYIALRMGARAADIPDSARLISLRRPPERVFDYFRKLHGLDREDEAAVLEEPPA